VLITCDFEVGAGSEDFSAVGGAGASVAAGGALFHVPDGEDSVANVVVSRHGQVVSSDPVQEHLLPAQK
jgi:hypothetical protein